MSEEEIERKIAVIFATDVVGYSKHMEADESSTIKNLRACEKILTALFKKHKGRLFNTGGDSFLAEFPSAVSAVECAVEFQNAIKDMQKKLKGQAPIRTLRDANLLNKGGLTTPTANQTGLKKLPTAVRNKMGYMYGGGMTKKKKTGSMDYRKGGLLIMISQAKPKKKGKK